MYELAMPGWAVIAVFISSTRLMLWKRLSQVLFPVKIWTWRWNQRQMIRHVNKSSEGLRVKTGCNWLYPSSLRLLDGCRFLGSPLWISICFYFGIRWICPGCMMCVLTFAVIHFMVIQGQLSQKQLETVLRALKMLRLPSQRSQVQLPLNPPTFGCYVMNWVISY